MTLNTENKNQISDIATANGTRQFVFGVDLDGVCGDYIGGLRETVAREKKVPLESLPLEVSWNCSEWDITSEDYEKLHSIAVERDKLFLNMTPHEGVSEALWELSETGVWIRIISHRLFKSGSHAVAASHTVQWLDNVGIPYRDICFIGGKQEVEADLYIEDSPSNIKSLRSHGKSVIVFEQPYNREVPGPRVSDWKEAKELVKESQRVFNLFHQYD